jgi:hypothetical protein
MEDRKILRVPRRTETGGVLIPSVHPDVMHEYGFANNRVMYRRVLLDGTPDAEEGLWRALNDDEILNRHAMRIPLLNAWLAEHGITDEAVDAVRESRRRARARKGRPRRR